MKLARWIVVCGLAYASTSWAITPQKYCESLAAMSCEVLNHEVQPGPGVAVAVNSSGPGPNMFSASSPILQIKYCRNRSFRSVFYSITSTPPTSSPAESAAIIGGGSEMNIKFNRAGSWQNQPISMNADLCSFAIYDPYGGNAQILP